ncbi:MAG: cobalt-precorrin-5B (C(1))-methyltransferase, partial [Chloroflexi bacterium]|nr:cobalt-precorrin-5B (C(1))-methyltransferase [Chloroflexota bacterium]
MADRAAQETKRTRSRAAMRTGYTTGACATAAAKAAALALTTGVCPTEVEITLPGGQLVTFALHRCELRDDGAEASVIKDAGDDPDITHGAEIVATLTWRDEPGLLLDRGPGVGQVTKPGIGLPVGDPAINQVPRRMITQHVTVVPGVDVQQRGLRVAISVPGGDVLALKTLNGRMGIIGGISILGTTGIVVPYSTAAFRASITQSINVAKVAGASEIVVTTGGRSEKYAMSILKERGLPPEAFVEMGDFTGHALKESAKAGMKRVTICGMIGKLTKIAQGRMQTHAAGSSVDTKYLSELAAEFGAPDDKVRAIRENTTARFFS